MDADIADYQAPNNNFDGFKVSYVICIRSVIDRNIGEQSLSIFKVLVHNSKGFADVSRLGFVIGPGVETCVTFIISLIQRTKLALL